MSSRVLSWGAVRRLHVALALRHREDVDIPPGYIEAIQRLAYRIRTWCQSVDVKGAARFRLGPEDVQIVAPLFLMPQIAANEPARAMLAALRGLYALSGESEPTVTMFAVALAALGIEVERVGLHELGLKVGGRS
jgi:hypothetical protein